MPRLLFTLCSSLSLLLFLALCVLWLRSYTLSDQLFWHRPDGNLQAWSAPGRLALGRWLASPSDQPLPTEDHRLQYRRDSIAYAGNRFLIDLNSDAGDIDISHEFAGFAWYEKRNANGRIYSQWVAPFAPLAAAVAILPLTWTIQRYRSHLRLRRRKSQGLCLSCGYDLRVQLAMSECSESNGRASPGRCPECGALAEFRTDPFSRWVAW